MTSTARRRLIRIAVTATTVLATWIGISALAESPATAAEPPWAVPDQYTVLDGQLSIAAPGLLENDEGTGLQVTDIRPSVPPPEYSLSWGADGSVEVTTGAEPGLHSFEYTITTETGATDTGAFNVNVGPIGPTCPGSIEAIDDAYTTPAATPLTIGAPGVAANDVVYSGYEYEVFEPEGPLYGTLQLNPDGSFGYTPPPNFIGTDTFMYTLHRPVPGPSSCPDQALVTVTVEPQ